MPRTPITDLIESCLTQKQWSERELARQLGCSKNTIPRIKKAGAPMYFHLALKQLMGLT